MLCVHVCLGMCVCVWDPVQVPQRRNAPREQSGQTHQGSLQTDGCLRWCIGLGILIGPQCPSHRGWWVCICAPACVGPCGCLSVSGETTVHLLFGLCLASKVCRLYYCGSTCGCVCGLQHTQRIELWVLLHFWSEFSQRRHAASTGDFLLSLWSAITWPCNCGAESVSSADFHSTKK